MASSTAFAHDHAVSSLLLVLAILENSHLFDIQRIQLYNV